MWNSTGDEFENLGNSLWCKKEVTRSNILNDFFIACPADFMVGVLGLLFYSLCGCLHHQPANHTKPHQTMSF